MTVLRIRDVTPDDAESIVAILNSIIAARIYSIFDAPFTVDAEREYIRRFPARGVFHAAVDDESGAMLGFQNVEPLVDYTRALDHVGSIGTYVAQAHRRQGVASRLFEATFDAARRKRYEKLFTFVRADNPAALAAYQRHGFRIVGTAEQHARIDGRDIDEIIIERRLERAGERRG